MTDRVVLRYWPGEEHNPIAIFMDQPDDPRKPWLVNSYQHIGQHGLCDIGVVHDTKPCKPDDEHAQALLRELRNFGYEPVVMQRIQRIRK